ncbi:hypothetical protein [Paraburkholderia sp. BL21I4N1]|uniref:hypothetical protein n=1 Tax=Paraburkholderia sp. BL21I4N1 TaxID=1938801 RepID=UPI000CFC6402|nr:hypothetical protein [Paraburkholderia sp. BL21I4N1]PQV51885.1 hypothetical protein B0G83_10494 [Paraburkholderia sp. BL21I4N1]
MNSETIDWLLEHSASAYETEFKATGQLRDRISFILGVAVTPYAGIATYLITKFKGSFLLGGDFLFFSLPMFAAIVLLIASAGLVAHALVGVHRYSNIPRPAELLPYLSAHPEPDKALEEAKINLIEAYANNIEHNFEVNQGRARKLRIAQRLAVLSLIPLALSLPRFVYSTVHTKAEPQSVRIIEPVQIAEEKNVSNKGTPNLQPNTSTPSPNQRQQPQQQGTNASQVAPTSAPRPPFPKSHMVLEELVDKVPPRNTNPDGKK